MTDRFIHQSTLHVNYFLRVSRFKIIWLLATDRNVPLQVLVQYINSENISEKSTEVLTEIQFCFNNIERF